MKHLFNGHNAPKEFARYNTLGSPSLGPCIERTYSGVTTTSLGCSSKTSIGLGDFFSRAEGSSNDADEHALISGLVSASNGLRFA